MKDKRSSRNKKRTQHYQAHPNAGASFHPRRLFRGLTVPFQSSPGQKYLYPHLRDKDGRQIMTPQEYKNKTNNVRPVAPAGE